MDPGTAARLHGAGGLADRCAAARTGIHRPGRRAGHPGRSGAASAAGCAAYGVFPCGSTDEALARWKSLWQLGHFPEKPIRAYLAAWRDRFWLFHPERPFWQVPAAEIGTEYTAAKLNGELSESGNKLRLFSAYAGAGKAEMGYAQAARWLLYINGYDDTSSKPKGKGLPSPGAGWLGKLGLIQATGKNLFETLMLNLVLLRDGETLWQPALPSWELEHSRSGERTEVPPPDNPAALLTLQSRRLLLHQSGDKVVGYSLLGGDFFNRENAFCEQMTVCADGKKCAALLLAPAPRSRQTILERVSRCICTAARYTPAGYRPLDRRAAKSTKPYFGQKDGGALPHRGRGIRR